jgi:hypothetical protein
MRRILHYAAAALMLAVTDPALAQTTAPTPAPAPAAAAGVADYWWVLLIIIIAGVAGWYFMRGRGQA